MTQNKIVEITIRRFESRRDSKRVQEIVRQIWDGATFALMEQGSVGL